MNATLILLALIVIIYIIYFGSKAYFKKTVTTNKVNQTDVIYFKNSQSAFEYACKYSANEIKVNQGIIAIVRETLPSMNENGAYYNKYLIQVADDDKGFLTIATTVDVENKPLAVDDLIIWVPYEYIPDAQRWFGFIRATVEPKLSIKDGWTVINKF